MSHLFRRLKHRWLPSIDEHPLSEEIQWERHNLFMAEVGSRMVGSVIVACVVGVMFYSSASTTALSIWFSGIAFVALNSWWLIRRHYQTKDQPRRLRDIRVWHWINLYLSIIWGIFWALTPFLFFPDANQIQILSLLLLVVVASSMPSVTMGCYPDIYVTFLTPVFFSFSWHLLSVDFGGELLPLLIAPMTWVMLVIFSVVIHRTHMESIILRLEHRKAQQFADERTAAKSRFIAVASHDLRQPVQAARLYAESMLTNPLLRTQETSEKLVSSLALASSLLDRLLDISKLDAGTIELNKQAMSVASLVQDIAAVHSTHANEKGIRLSLETMETMETMDLTVLADHSVLTEILDNVLGNAVRYTDDGQVTISVSETESGEVCISVRDTGCGIPEEKQALIFEEFVQLDSASGSNQQAGMGLGLPIVKRLCELHGIGFELSSRVGSGTEFRLFLEKKSPDRVTDSVTEAMTASNGLRVLVVDDEPLITDALSMTLVGEGHDVWVAHSVREVEDTLLAGKCIPDVVITDDRLPGLARSQDVIQCVTRLLEYQVPVIIMTGNTSPERIQILEHSGHPVLFKPVSSHQLLNTLTAVSQVSEAPAV
ncbi:MAG: hypothetical protein CMK92_03100 [Pseudomonas sp.]|nr:hypothetical protein [Pseudomonas sp.]